MKYRTNITVERSLLDEASEILGTKGPTKTVSASLAEVVKKERLRELASWDLVDLTPETLEQMRKPRSASSNGG